MVTGEIGARVASPNGSRPRLPTVHRPKENLCSFFGCKLFIACSLLKLQQIDGDRVRNLRISQRKGAIVAEKGGSGKRHRWIVQNSKTYWRRQEMRLPVMSGELPTGSA